MTRAAGEGLAEQTPTSPPWPLRVPVVLAAGPHPRSQEPEATRRRQGRNVQAVFLDPLQAIAYQALDTRSTPAMRPDPRLVLHLYI